MKSISKPVSMDHEMVRKDIHTWVCTAIKEDPHISKWNPDLRERVREMLPEKAQGM
jgi:hypothetical protein